MPKAYWIATYRAVKDPEALADYAKMAAPAMAEGGAKFLARGMPTKVYEMGLNQRTVVIEFPSMEAAIKTHDSAGYQAALKRLGNGAEREIRLVEGVE